LRGGLWGSVRASHGGRDAEDAAEAQERVVGTVRQHRRRFFIEPDGKQRRDDIPVAQSLLNDAVDGDKVVAVVRARGRHGDQEGEIIEVLGRAGSPAVESMALARRYGLDPDFPNAVEDEAHAFPVNIPPEEYEKRTDLRELELFTIDPEDARDFDDAVSLEHTGDGRYRLGVHIADVSYFVQPRSAMDREAYRRGTSVYLVDDVIPMLPERLSNHLCSLKQDEDRLAMSLFMTISQRGVVQDYELHRSVIRSKKRFTYSEAQGVLDGGDGPHADVLREMRDLADILMKKRFREGAIDFSVPETRIILNEARMPVDIVPKERLFTMRMIEEFMLAANRTIATWAWKSGARNDAFIFRVHDRPDPEKVRELVEFLRHLGIKAHLDPTASQTFQAMVTSLRGSPEEGVVQDVTIRSMAKAIYSERNIGHFGLGFKLYTHFTSPIRRYPDLVVHRLAASVLLGEEGGARFTPARLADIAAQSSARERLAVEAERDSVRIKQAEFMRTQVGEEYDAIISGVTSFGFFVEVLPSLVQGLVHMRALDDDYYDFDPHGRRLIGRSSGNEYMMGDRVRVKLVRVDLEEMQIDFTLI
jgi:ribonuclease R